MSKFNACQISRRMHVQHVEVENKQGNTVKCDPKVMEFITCIAEKMTPNKIDINDAHDKFGHVRCKMLKRTAEKAGCILEGNSVLCEACSLAKARAKHVPKALKIKATKKGERLCINMSGPCKKSIAGNECWALAVDKFTRKSWSCFVKRKSELIAKANELANIQKTAGDMIKHMRC